MGEIIIRKVKGMNWKAKIALVLMFTLVFSTFMQQGLWKPKLADAAVTNVSVGTLTNGWAHPSTGTTGPYTITNATFSCGAGSDRLLVVIVEAEVGTAEVPAVTITKGTGVNHALAVRNTTASRNQAYIGYFTEAQINGNTNSIVVTRAGTQVWSGSDVYLGCFSGVNQTTPLAGTQQLGDSSGTATTFALSIPAVNGGMVIVANAQNNGANAVTVPSGYTEPYDLAGTGYGTEMAFKAVTATGTETGNFTWTAARMASAAISLNPAATNGTLAFTASNFTFDEAAGTVNATVSRTGGSSGAVTVQCAVANGTAASPGDYTATTPQTLNWADGDTANKTCSIAIVNDSTPESSETVNLTLSTATGGATIGAQSTATITITDNDQPGTLQFTGAAYSVSESVGTTSTITVSRTGGSVGAVSVQCSTVAGGTATAGTDYTSVTNQVLNWADGDAANKTCNIAITSDTLDEANETVNLQLSGAGGGATIGAQSTSVMTITDDDATPTVDFNAATSNASEVSTLAVIPVSLSAASGQTITVNYATTSTGVTAPAATVTTDYTATSGTLTFNPGETTKNINVTIVNDAVTDPGEHFRVTLSAPSNATLAGLNNPHEVTIMETLSSTITSCAGCHGYGAAFPDGTARNTPAGQFQGSHKLHVQDNSYVCSTCHTAPATETAADYKHRDGSVQIANPIDGAGTYSKSSFTQTNAAFSGGTCSTVYCHGTNSGTWGTNTTNAVCTKCHGTPTAVASYSLNKAAPGIETTGVDTAGQTGATDAQVGAHDTHLRALNSISSPIACNECHTVPTAVSDAGHNDSALPAEKTWGTLATTNSASPAWSSPNCTTTYCHFGASINGYSPATANASVSWTNTAYLAGTTADCQKCHLSPPSTTGTHNGVSFPGGCNTCHSHVSVAGAITDVTLHINGIVEGGSCVDCHAQVQTGTHGTPRDAVFNEFGLNWGHKKSGRGTVTDADCIVCHLEGDYASQGPSALHKDGNIDLRDPDGAGETPITNNSGGAFTFTKYSVSYAASARPTAVDNSISQVITVKFCMKCHDADGATNTTARSNNGGTGTAFMPFGGVNMGATYTTANGAAAAGGLINVAKQFLSTNSSRHPVGAPNNRAYPYSTRLATPYNGLGTARDGNLTTGTAATPRTKANSVVMVCDDCHTDNLAIASRITNRTITAHGNAISVPGTYFVASPTLCTTCHIGTYADATNGRHNSGSAFAIGTTRAAPAMTRCNFCHFSQNESYAAASRPRWAQDTHGFNEIYNTTGGWTAGFANGMRPVAFMRSHVNSGGSWPTTNSPRPYTATTGGPGQFNLAAGQPNCGSDTSGTTDFAFNMTGSGLTQCTSNGHDNYSPGGSY